MQAICLSLSLPPTHVAGHTHLCINTQSDTHAHLFVSLSPTRVSTHTHTHTHLCINTHSGTHALAHIYTHTHACTHYP